MPVVLVLLRMAPATTTVLLRRWARLVPRLLLIATRLLAVAARLLLKSPLLRLALRPLLELRTALWLLPILELWPVLIVRCAVIVIERVLRRPSIPLRSMEAHRTLCRHSLRVTAVVLRVEASIVARSHHVLLLH